MTINFISYNFGTSKENEMTEKQFLNKVKYYRNKGVTIFMAAIQARLSVMTINRYMREGYNRNPLKVEQIIKGFKRALEEEKQKL